MELNEESVTKHSDFSIEHILNRAGNNITRNEGDLRHNPVESFHWLQCSRYCPPKVPRINKKETFQKRQLGRHPRIPFTSTQLSILEQKFQESPYLSSDEVMTLSQKLKLADIRVKIWFQNRRARERRERNSTSNDNRANPENPQNGETNERREQTFYKHLLTNINENSVSIFTMSNERDPKKISEETAVGSHTHSSHEYVVNYEIGQKVVSSMFPFAKYSTANEEDSREWIGPNGTISWPARSLDLIVVHMERYGQFRVCSNQYARQYTI
ncbi:brain-specific homeobox protein homolog [Cylas formicarius]|uniref:brain-specific homeobox protein homolog n=1 Tax=Cylas formicarius TaxID=197179 RepID=UPI0029585096|nr:brain-specific homeobox protein homolog [Cylas formicarius]